MEGNGIGLGDAMLLANQNKDGFGYGGGCFFWVIILFWLMAGNNGWGNNNNGQMAADLAAAKTQASVWQSNDQQNLMGAINTVREGNISLGNGIADATFALNNTVNNGFTGVMRDSFSMQQAMMGGFNNVAQAVNENRFAAQSCCCETNRNIDSLRYDAALNTANINNVATGNTQKILDKLCSMEMNAKDAQIAQLQLDLQAAQLTLGNAAQTQSIVTALKPPTYLAAYTPCGYQA